MMSWLVQKLENKTVNILSLDRFLSLCIYVHTLCLCSVVVQTAAKSPADELKRSFELHYNCIVVGSNFRQDIINGQWNTDWYVSDFKSIRYLVIYS